MGIKKKMFGLITALAITLSVSPVNVSTNKNVLAAGSDISSQMEWGAVKLGGGGFVSGIVTGQKEMYLRTDVGGAYKYNYEKEKWEQMLGFLNENDKGLLSVKGMAIDPTDDNILYMLCGCAYFSDARTVIFKTTDGGKTWTQSDVTSMIQVHGNGDGRECVEPIAVDPDNPDIIYAGGDVTAGNSALIKSTDGGKTWEFVKGYDDLGLFTESLKFPTWTDHMVRGTESKEYNEQNGIGAILIEDGKVYVGTSVKGQTNIHVADVNKDEFTALSKDLPTDNYPLSITSDKNGSLFFTYIAGLAFAGSAGGAFKYDKASGKVTDITPPKSGAIGMIEADRENPDKLLARTCGLWSDQWYEKEWTDGSIAWGDHFYRSTDGGANWTDITPGQGETIYDENGSHKVFTSLPIDTNGYDWIYGKACHWGSGILLDPRDPDHIYMTSGNGVFRCDNVWAEKEIQFYFDPDGVEEVVALDMVSVPGGSAYSAIGDYDGYEHVDVNEIGLQYTPNMGSTSSISYCAQNSQVMARFSEHDKGGYYSTDSGKTWTQMANASKGGKSAIVWLKGSVYRIFKSTEGGMSYSDDFGDTWNSIDLEGLYRKCTPYPFVNPENPKYVYAYGYSQSENEYDPTKAEYKLYVSSDYGKTFSAPISICAYDYCDAATRIAYDNRGGIFLGGGWNGLYHVDMEGKEIRSCDVFYCKTVGYGAPEPLPDGELSFMPLYNTLYMYGKPTESDPEGIYRSTDAGGTWVCINTDKIYGGTGNGNFLVGDMNEFGTVYMSTVGCGIVYGRLSNDPDLPKPTDPTDPTDPKPTDPNPTTPDPTDDDPTDPPVPTGDQKPANTDPDLIAKAHWGDVNVDEKVNIADAVALSKYLVDSSSNPVTDQGLVNANCQYDEYIDTLDSTLIVNYSAMLIAYETLGPQN